MKFADVSVSVPRLCKCLSTVGTGKRSLPRVRPHVNVQLVFANEAFVAAGARVRLVSCVVALVHLQLRHASVTPPTLGTVVAGRLVHVLPAVQPQRAVGAKTLTALRALEGFFSGVDDDVQLEAGGRREAVPADGAEVGSLTVVDGQVSLQLVLVQERFATDGTGLWQLPLM